MDNPVHFKRSGQRDFLCRTVCREYQQWTSLPQSFAHHVQEGTACKDCATFLTAGDMLVDLLSTPEKCLILAMFGFNVCRRLEADGTVVYTITDKAKVEPGSWRLQGDESLLSQTIVDMDIPRDAAFDAMTGIAQVDRDRPMQIRAFLLGNPAAFVAAWRLYLEYLSGRLCRREAAFRRAK
jgi:hypothetical protein